MCTVSFIPLPNRVLFAHNRDEQVNRPRALAPKEHIINGYTLLYPEDGLAGGSWIGCNTNGSAAVLLNGAFEKHVHQPPYQKSRGLIFLQVLAANDIYLSYQNIDLNGIEPFTVVLWSSHQLHECRWDGKQKYFLPLDATTPHTWSSVTLYDAAVRQKRKTWFNNWLQLHPHPSADELLQFHLLAGDGDPENNLRMSRQRKLLTVSTTVMEISENKAIIQYLDLQNDKISRQDFIFTKAAALQ